MATRMTGEQRREQLLDATKAIVLEDGFHAVSIEAVARERGIRVRSLTATSTISAACSRRSSSVRPSGRWPSSRPLRRPARSACRLPRRRVRDDPDTWRLVPPPQEGAPRLLHERIEGGRAAARSGSRTRSPAGLPDPEPSRHMLSAYADQAARLTLGASTRSRILRADALGARRRLALAGRVARSMTAGPLAEREPQGGLQALGFGREHAGRDRDHAGLVMATAHELGCVASRPDVRRRALGRARAKPACRERGAQVVALGLQALPREAAYQPSSSRSAAVLAYWNGVPLANVRNCLAARTAATIRAGPSPNRSSSR